MAGKKKTEKKTPDVATADHYSVILSPVITEKSSIQGGAGNVVIFKVHRDACKCAIKEAVEKVFKVNVSRVRTCNFIGKMKRTAKGMTRRAGYRKAYVTLREGQTINIVEGL